MPCGHQPRSCTGPTRSANGRRPTRTAGGTRPRRFRRLLAKACSLTRRSCDVFDKAGMALMVAVAGSAKSATLGLAEADAVRGLRIFPIFRGPQTGMCLLETGMPASLVCCPLCSRPTLQFSPGEAANELKIRVPSPFLAPIEFIFPGTKR